MSLILGSSSKTRQMLLNRLGIPFTITPPEIDETPHEFETPIEHVKRLAHEKSAAVRKASKPNDIIITSDQVMLLQDEIISKPKDTEDAIRQILACSGKTITFYTSLLVKNTHYNVEPEAILTTVKYRDYNIESARRYVEREYTLNAAGSIHCEGLGISLLDSITSDDPTAILGLPLISVCKHLRQLGILDI